MREIDRGVYTNISENYIVGIINNLHTFITDFKSGTLTLRILDDFAKLYVNVISKQGYRRVYDFEVELDIAHIFINAYGLDETIKTYRYYVTYEDSVTRVYQYELGEKAEPIITLEYLNNNVIKKNDQTVVVQQPAISGPNILTPFKPEKYVVISKIMSKEDTLITNFIVEFNNKTYPVYMLPNVQNAETSFDLTIDPGEYHSGDVLELKVTAVDNERHYSSTAIKEITIYAGKIKTPTILVPYDNNYINPNNIYLEVSDFTLIKAIDPQQISTDWKITTDRKGNNIVKKGNFEGEEHNFALNFDNDLEPGNYFIFVRQEDRYIGYSDWSLPTKVVVDENYTFEQVIPPYIQSVVWINRDDSYTLHLWSNTVIDEKISQLRNPSYTKKFDKIVEFKIHDYLTNTEVSIPTLAALESGNEEDIGDSQSTEIADYTFTVPSDAEFYFDGEHKEYIISVKAVDINGFESLNNYAFVRVLDHVQLYKKSISLIEEKLYEMNDVIPPEYSGYKFIGTIHSPIGCSVFTQNDTIKITATGVIGFPASFVYTILSPDEQEEVFILVELNVERMPEIEGYFFDSDNEINSLMSSYVTPSMQEIYTTWTRFGNFNEIYPEGSSYYNDSSRWDYQNNAPITTIDTASPIGFISKSTYMYYTLEVNIASTDSDDDIMGVVLAFNHTQDKNQMLVAACVGHTVEQPPLPLIRNNFGILYIDGETIKILRTSPVNLDGSTGYWNLQSPVRIYVERTGSKFRVKASNFTKTIFNENTTLELDIENYADDNWGLSWALSPSPYGLFAWSQPAATFNTLVLSGAEDIKTMYSIESGKLVTFAGGNWTQINQSAQDYFGYPKLVRNKYTSSNYFILQNEVRKVTEEEINLRYRYANILKD